MKQFYLKTFTLLIAFGLYCICAKADQFVEINGVYYILKPVKVGTASVTYNQNNFNERYVGDVVIPSTVEYEGNTYTVTGIDYMAFTGCGELTSIELPNTITTIGSYCFERCTNLRSINIPTNLASISKDAFSGCKNLSVYINDLGNWCKIDFGYYANNPLYYADKMILNGEDTKNLVIPANIETIGDHAFEGFKGLTSVVIEGENTTIGSSAFNECTSLLSVQIPDNVSQIGSYAFADCWSLQVINIPNKVTIIEKGAFEYLKSIESIVIPEGVQIIDTYAFRGCTKLKKIFIPSSTTRIGASAFGNCENIKDVYCFATIPPNPNGLFSKKSVSDYFMNSYVNYSSLHVPETSLEAYKNHEYWNDFGTMVALTNEDAGINHQAISTENGEVIYNTIDGRKIESTRKGIYIIRNNSGQTRKIIITR